jgi:hypothetical protein
MYGEYDFESESEYAYEYVSGVDAVVGNECDVDLGDIEKDIWPGGEAILGWVPMHRCVCLLYMYC